MISIVVTKRHLLAVEVVNFSRQLYANDGRREFLTKCIVFFNQVPIELLKISNLNAVHLCKKFFATIFNVILYLTIILNDSWGGVRIDLLMSREPTARASRCKAGIELRIL